MAEDLEVGVKLVPDESAIEDVEDQELTVEGGDSGGVSPSERNTRQGFISGGFKTALLSLGVIGLLSQLKPIVATLQAIFGIIGRTLVPLVEAVAEVLRPINEKVNDLLEQAPTTEETLNNPIVRATGISSLAELTRGDFSGFAQENVEGSAIAQGFGLLGDALANNSNGNNVGGGTPDQSDEADKIDLVNDVTTAKQEITGGIE